MSTSESTAEVRPLEVLSFICVLSLLVKQHSSLASYGAVEVMGGLRSCLNVGVYVGAGAVM